MTTEIVMKPVASVEAPDGGRCAVESLFGGSVLEELARLDKIVRDCEHSLLIAERLKARNRWQTKWDAELVTVREKLANAIRERDWLDGAISRYASSPNTQEEVTAPRTPSSEASP